MQFQWDAVKAATNLRKRRVTFEEASSVFADPLALTFRDPDHSTGQARFLTFGISEVGKLLVVAHTRRGRSIRVISSRRATRSERRIYEEG
jgi:hypothetical protein